jgi:hypothetical protein
MYLHTFRDSVSDDKIPFLRTQLYPRQLYPLRSFPL